MPFSRNNAKSDTSCLARGFSTIDLLSDLEDITAAAKRLTQPDETHDLAAGEEMAELLAKRNERLERLVSVGSFNREEHWRTLRSLIDYVRGGDYLSCRHSDDADVLYCGLERVCECLRQQWQFLSDMADRTGPAKGKRSQSTYPGRDAASAPIIHRFQLAQPTLTPVIVGVSRGWCQFLGYSPDEVIGLDNAKILTEESLRGRDRTVTDLQNDGYVDDRRCQVVTKAGKVKNVRFSVICEPQSTGEPMRGITISKPYD